jgi:hypothetical protein
MVRCNWCVWPDLADFSDSLFYSRAFQISNQPAFWRCESLATLLAIYGVVLLAWFGGIQVSQLNPSDAFMGVSIIEKGLCLNLTCSALYCSVTAPQSCKKTPVHMKQLETVEFCSADPGCDWNIEVLSDSSFENRSTCVSVDNPQSDQITYFPQLENMKRQFVDITKYVNAQSGYPIVSFDIVSRTRSKQMSSCGAALPESMKTDTRCGSYSMFLVNTEYQTVSRKRYATDLAVILLLTIAAIGTLSPMFRWLLGIYRGAKTLETELQRSHKD